MMDELQLQPTKARIPVVSWIGLVSLALSIVIFGINTIQNRDAIARVEELQTKQQEFAEARAPATRTALCNLEVAITSFSPPPPVGSERRKAYDIIIQNVRALDCPKALVEITSPGPKSPP